MDMVPQLARRDEVPVFLVGDFNDWRNTLAKNVFSDHHFAQITAPMSRFRSFPAYLSVGSLDKAFSRGDIVVRHARVVRTQAAKIASDHLPLVIDFHLGEPPHGK